jgi:hypothetical protein
MISVPGNNKFAYSTGCNTDVTTEQLTRGLRRESSGLLQSVPVTVELPKARSGNIYCPYSLASDPSNHLAFVMRQLHKDLDEGEPDGPFLLASYTSNSTTGNLTTKSTASTMPILAAFIRRRDFDTVQPK